jgi:hypothetical protein
MDADVLWPHTIEVLPGPLQENAGSPYKYTHDNIARLKVGLIRGYLYTPLRRMAPWPLPSVPNEHCKTCYGSGTMYAPPLKDQEEQSLKNQRVWATHVPCKCRTPSIPPENEWTKYPIHRNTKEWAGYSQIFHADDPVLGQPPWYDISWSHAGGADSAFQHKWTEDKKIRPILSDSSPDCVASIPFLSPQDVPYPVPIRPADIRPPLPLASVIGQGRGCRRIVQIAR